MNLPNSLTLLRIFLVPVLVVVLLTKKTGHGLLIGTGIFGLGGSGSEFASISGFAPIPSPAGGPISTAFGLGARIHF